MITINSISGGQTSAYIAANYKADYNLFALVTTYDIKCKYPDEKIRQVVSDKISREFIGTLEDDKIIKTMLDLEQYLGSKIDWCAGESFDNIIKRKNKDGKHSTYLPNPTMRFCTTEMKLRPMAEWWKKNINEPVEMRIGFRANEVRRANNMIQKLNKNGFSEFKIICGKSSNGRNKWETIQWQKPSFPLIKDGIFKDNIIEYWKDKPVRFAKHNNCIGCFHREIHFLKFMSQKHPNKFQWFIDQEIESRKSYNDRSWNLKVSYEKIKDHQMQISLFDEDFNECDSGYCGL